ncbi:hypothetical protein B0H11DRAFT_859106 [Mycena galericulata]|nr:hypothetical protein B0H11DRAFT_859106 [Mycena galericulata]
MPFAHVTEDFSDEEESDYSDNAHVASSEELHGSTSHRDGYVEPGNQVQAERPSDGVWSIQNNPNFGSPGLVGPLASASMQGPYSSDRSFDLPRPAFPQHISLPNYDGNKFWVPGSNFDASATHVDYFPLPTNSDASFDFGGNSSQQLSTFFLPNSSRPDTTHVDFFPSQAFDIFSPMDPSSKSNFSVHPRSEVTSPFSSAPATSYTWPQLLPSQPDAASEQQMTPAIQTVPRLDHKESPTSQKRPAEELDSERPSKRARAIFVGTSSEQLE